MWVCVDLLGAKKRGRYVMYWMRSDAFKKIGSIAGNYKVLACNYLHCVAESAFGWVAFLFIVLKVV